MTTELKQAKTEQPKTKSGFILNLPLTPGGCGHFKATSESGLIDIEVFIDPERDVAGIKLRYHGKHPQLEKIPAGARYPEYYGSNLLEMIEEYLQKE